MSAPATEPDPLPRIRPEVAAFFIDELKGGSEVWGR
jgi:hypothetical protein